MSEQKKRGRPPKPAGERRRHNQTFRCTDQMLAKLQEASALGQRSLSEEVERRLEQSFDIYEIIRDASEAAAATAIKNQQLSQFGSRLVFESSWLYAQILQGLIERLKENAAPSPDWFMPIEDIKEYLKKEMALRVDGMVEVLCFDIAMMDLEGWEKYEADAFRRTHTVPKEIAGAYLSYEVRKHAIRHKLLPHIMDAMEREEVDN